eukprot:g2490.t1
MLWTRYLCAGLKSFLAECTARHARLCYFGRPEELSQSSRWQWPWREDFAELVLVSKQEGDLHVGPEQIVVRDGRRVLLGRLDFNDVQVNHRKISGKHLELRWASGRVKLQVLGSLGCWLNDVYMDKGTKFCMDHSEKITLATKPKDIKSVKELKDHVEICSFQLRVHSRQSPREDSERVSENPRQFCSPCPLTVSSRVKDGQHLSGVDSATAAGGEASRGDHHQRQEEPMLAVTTGGAGLTKLRQAKDKAEEELKDFREKEEARFQKETGTKTSANPADSLKVSTQTEIDGVHQDYAKNKVKTIQYVVSKVLEVPATLSDTQKQALKTGAI